MDAVKFIKEYKRMICALGGICCNMPLPEE